MRVFISDIDTAKFYIHFFRPLAQCQFHSSVDLYPEHSEWVIPKVVGVAYGSVLLRDLFITKFNLQFKRGVTKVVVTRAGRLREWSHGELRLYV